jgi:hypothetical protein
VVSTAAQTYTIGDVSVTSPRGTNQIDVTADIQTTDSGAQVYVQSLRNGSVRDETDPVSVSATQPQTFSVAGQNQADEVRVVLVDAGRSEQATRTVPYP